MTPASADRRRQTARVFALLDESFCAYQRGDKDAATRAATAACELDVECVSVIQGGIVIGEIPDPERDPSAWADYVAAAHAAVDEADRRGAAVAASSEREADDA